jgi:hypothetical protein
MYRVMERVAKTIYPGATVLPVGPASTESEALNYPAHGDVERLAESSLYPFVQYVWNVVTEVAAQK